MESKIISKVFEQHNIRQRATDGYLSATDMCKAFGREFKNYNKSQATREYVDELKNSVVLHGTTDIIDIKQGGIPQEQGTWVHPRVAIHLAQWLSPKFSITVTDWVLRYLSGDTTLIGEIVQNHEQATGERITRIDFDYEERLLKLEQMRNEIAKSKEETEKLRVENTERKRQLLIDMDAFKGDAQIYSVFKNNVMNTFGLAVPSNNQNDVTQNKDISTLYFEMTGRHANSAQLPKLGKQIKREYVRRYDEEPLKISKHVNGAMRDVYVYTARDYEWIRGIISDEQ